MFIRSFDMKNVLNADHVKRITIKDYGGDNGKYICADFEICR